MMGFEKRVSVWIAWAGIGVLGAGPAVRAQSGLQCAIRDGDFRKVVLADSGLSDPMELAAAPDGRIFFIERRSGNVKVWKPETGRITVVARFQVASVGNNGTTDLEDGMMGLALAPGFPADPWIYLYYSPVELKERNVLSRFTVVGDLLDPLSEKRLLSVPISRETCCHSSGSLAFGPTGDLFLSIGDNTNPWFSSGYNPIDETKGKSAFDAQKSSSNTNDLRGKILRIHPEPDGTYSIPAGNLFPPSAEPSVSSKTRPEIFTMGNRNPFRISVDQMTGWLYWGEVGPDAASPSANHGPAGFDEFNIAKAAGNYGWPYFVADNRAYRDFDFTTNVSGAYYSEAAPVNASPNNTGLTTLPPARRAALWYGHGAPSALPGFTGEGNATAMGGPIYHYDSTATSKRRLPPQFDNHWFVYDWTNAWIKAIRLDKDGMPVEAKPFAAGVGTIPRPVDMELGPDGALYLLEFGKGWFSSTEGAKLVRIEYTGSCLTTAAHGSRRPDFHSPIIGVAGSLRMLSDATSRTLSLPAGTKAIQLFDMRGRLLWERRGLVAMGGRRIVIPESVPAGLARIRMRGSR